MEQKKVDNWLCIFDIQNRQSSYANAMRIISFLESLDDLDRPDSDNSDNDFFFKISRLPNGGINNASAINKIEEMLNDDKNIREITSIDQLINGLKKNTNYKFHYYLRVSINNDNGDIVELQYLFLFLQSFRDISNKTSIYFYKEEMSEWALSDYYRLSHFLQFVQKTYDIFYAKEYNNSPIKKLTKIKAGTQSTFCPLLEITGDTWRLLNRTWKIKAVQNTENIKFNYLYKCFLPESCEDNFTSELFQIGFKILFEATDGRKFYKNKKYLIDMICKSINNMQGVTVLDTLIFGAMGGQVLSEKSKEKNLPDIINGILENVRELSSALGQLLENIVNHSQHGKGMFTYRIQNNKEYLQKNYPEYFMEGVYKGLEILISDSNQTDNIVSHFINSAKASSSLKEKKNNIVLSDLFGCYQNTEMESIWRKQREERPTLCHGLISFKQSLSLLHGAVKVRSDSSYFNNSEQCLFYYNGDSIQTDKILNSEYAFLPGTQFSILIDRLSPHILERRMNFKENYDFNKLTYSVTYEDLAKALLFVNDERFLEKSIIEDNLKAPIKSQADKDLAVNNWIEIFNRNFESQIKTNTDYHLLSVDIKEICSKGEQEPDICESFCKGFLSSEYFTKREEDHYFSIILWNCSEKFASVFNNELQIVSKYSNFCYAKTNAYLYFIQSDGNFNNYSFYELNNLLGGPRNNEIFPLAFPFNLIVYGNTDKGSLFEEELMTQANESITEKAQGYKVVDTHMRLGNKVHLDTFYEMSLFFENPNYASCTAFLFLKKFIKSKPEIFNKEKEKENLLIYGYASYSRSIVWASIQILEYYQNLYGQIFKEIQFAIYQNDLKLETDQPNIQMYLSKESWQRSLETMEWVPETTALTLIVPISSSLTTFDKMLAELNRQTKKDFNSNFNFTAFWVRNNFDKFEQPTGDIEGLFWNNVNVRDKIIVSDLIKDDVHYLCYGTSGWNDPLQCKFCFPDLLTDELPLVETDPTSTIPTQQFYLPSTKSAKSPTKDSENDKRVAKLYRNILYGHITRGHNHYQYYIKTREYFQQERQEIKNWLIELRKKTSKNVISENVINIIVLPQQTNNIEFGQYVYEYFFQGKAESIVINTEKDFRSNLIAEYSNLFERINSEIEKSSVIKFHYVDVSVQSGSSFNRIVSILNSCLRGKSHFKFDKIFLLISRLSEDSKKIYVENVENDFHAYVQLNISSMRTFGDSCVPCKLYMEADKLFKRAATKSISEYWQNKKVSRKAKSFDSEQNEIDENSADVDIGYMRMICTHRAQRFFSSVKGRDSEKYFLTLLDFVKEIIDSLSNDCDSIYTVLEGKTIAISNRNFTDWLGAAFKIIARPFMSFDYKAKKASMTFFLVLAEYFIQDIPIRQLTKNLCKNKFKYETIYKESIEEKLNAIVSIMEKTLADKKELWTFIRENILKGLADLKSNYLFRLKTIIAIKNKLNELNDIKFKKDFYEHYLRSILRVINSSSDDAKSVWLEHLLRYGKEYKSEGESNINLIQENEEDEEFKEFSELLLIENNRPLYQTVEELEKANNYSREIDGTTIENLLNKYYMKNANCFLNFSEEFDDVEKRKQILSALYNLSRLLKDNTDQSEIGRYDDLADCIRKIADVNANNGDDVVIFGESPKESQQNIYLKIPPIFLLVFSNEDTEKKEWFMQKTEKLLETKNLLETKKNLLEDSQSEKIKLQRNGYILLKGKNNYNVLLYLNNNYTDKNKNEIQKIDPIYIYIPCNLKYIKALELVRKILMFRCKLIKWLEKDFSNNAIKSFMEQRYISQVLSKDKMGDHADETFVECHQRLLLMDDEENVSANDGDYEVNDILSLFRKEIQGRDSLKCDLFANLSDIRQWFFLRSYVNSRIARLYHSLVRNNNDPDFQNQESKNLYYRDEKSVLQGLAENFYDLFFGTIKDRESRRNYLKQMLKTVTFKVDGIKDWKDASDTVDERLNLISESFKNYNIITLESNGKKNGYVAEYLAIIILDCIISAIKAGETWNTNEWGEEAFIKLNNLPPDKKCAISFERGDVKEFHNIKYQYLKISNSIYHPLKAKKESSGMSKASMEWYINGLWRKWAKDCGYKSEEFPQVETIKKENEYCVKLPILIPVKNNNID